MTHSLVVPLVLWGSRPPTHRISCILVSPDLKTIVTGCRDGQLCLWSVEDHAITPRCMLFGHTSSVVGLTAIPGVEMEWNKQHIVSVSESGEICLWDLVDGKCLEQSKLPGKPASITGHNFVLDNVPQQCIMCCGQFSEILLLSASSLSVLVSLVSRICPDWISCACVVPCLRSSEPSVVIGTTVGGSIKVWRIHKSSSQAVFFEEDSKQLNHLTAQSIKVDDSGRRFLLIIHSSTWQVCDISDYSVLCSCAAPVGGHPLVDGYFLSSETVAVWSRNGDITVYKLSFSASDQKHRRSALNSATPCVPAVVQTISLLKTDHFVLPPAVAFQYATDKGPLYLAVGNCHGVITFAEVSQTTYALGTLFKNSLYDLWTSFNKKPTGIVDQLSHDPENPLNVTSTLFIIQFCYLCCGREDGSIVIVPAAQTCKAHLLKDELCNRKGWPPHRTLRGHHDSVTCLLYPHQEAPKRYSSEFLLSGGSDFSVILWDINSGTVMHSFHVHGGELTQLIIPPDGCNQRVNQSICSVASDHSVALLNLKDRKCILLASRHPSPIVEIRWRPEDDYMILSCADMTVFVWQMETGHLDRFETGAVAADILKACDELENVRTDMVAQSSINLLQVFKHRSLSAFKAVAQQGLKSLIDGLGVDNSENESNVQDGGKLYRAMVISSLRASPLHDSDSHVVFINTEALITRLLLDHSANSKQHASQQRRNDDESSPARSGKKVINNLLRQVKHQFLDEDSDSSIPELRVATARKGKKATTFLDIDSAKNVAQVFVSCVHGWGLDSKLDELCSGTLGLMPPKSIVSFGLLSRGGHMALQLPKSSTSMHPVNELQIHSSHWKSSSSLTTQLLMAIISIANTVMELPDASFVKKVSRKNRCHADNTDSTSEDVYEEQLQLVDQSQVKQGWSLLATLHCVLLPEKTEDARYKPPKLELLARRWQDRCLELREAAQALMLAELRQMGHEGRRQVVEFWSRHVPDYVSHSATSLGGLQLDSLLPHHAMEEPIDGSSTGSDDLISGLQGQSTNVASASKLSYEVRRRHATAIVILGVIGAEFGQELKPRRRELRNSSDVPEGFGITDYSLARHTCKALVYLLLHPPSTKLPAHIPIRRAAIDLLGRGFTVWEPFMEVTAVLLGLLELCESYSKHLADIQSGLPLSPEADACRTAHHSLSLIATARPLTFITTIAREVARHNAAAANPQHQALLATSVLVRAKPEILRIIDLLSDKMMSDISNVLVEVVDIVLFCIDVSILRASHGLLEAVPSLAKFHTVSYDGRSRRVAVAAGNGSIVLYDTRTCKHQLVSRGSSRITALCFSPDGKYLSVYSAADNQLTFWITATSLFGMLQSHVKCVKTISPLQLPQQSKNGGAGHSKMSFAKLVWVNNRVVVLLLTDGHEYRFHI